MSDIVSSLLLLGALSGTPDMPFWATSGQYGIMPESSGALALFQASTRFDERKSFMYRWEASLAIRSDASSTIELIPDELYVSGRWKVFNLDLGIKHRERDFIGAEPLLGSLSATSGHLIWSSNTRSMPGYTASLLPVDVPLTGGHLQVYGTIGDYMMTGERYVSDALLHRLQANIRFNFTKNFRFIFGLDHYALWAGESPDYGKLPNGFQDYMIVFIGGRGRSNAAETDQINILGDHRGAELFRFEYDGPSWRLTAQHEIPYDDTSGMKFRNFPDGVNTICLSFADKNRWVSDIVYEHHYTMWQSGTWHEKDGVILGGCDDYFNNRWEYKTGWTAYGRTIGNPLMVPVGTHDGSWDRNGLCLGVENNRIKAHHIGIGGKICRRFPYRLMATYSENYGCYEKQYTGENQAHHEWGTVKETPLRALYLGLSSDISLSRVQGLSLVPGLWADFGEMRGNCFAVTAGIRYSIR